MQNETRRHFLSDVGKGMIAGSLGLGLATELGLSTLAANDDDDSIGFGKLSPLVQLLQDTPVKQLQPAIVEQIRSGVSLKSLVSAGTLANANAFKGQDYIGYHTFMALAPSLDMAQRLPTAAKPLPVLKVLYRNSQRMHATGSRDGAYAKLPEGAKISTADGAALQAATRAGNQEKAERILAAMGDQPAGEIFNHVQYAVHDSANVHRVVLAWRSWLALDLVGPEHAQLMLRQSVRFCADDSRQRLKRGHKDPELWSTLPKLLDEHRLLEKPAGKRRGEDAWVEQLAFTIFTGSPEGAMEAVAQAMSEGFESESLGEAISLAANMQLLHDPGRDKASNYDKIKGSVHGDSPGVHASDAANAWRNIARVSNRRNAVVSLLLGAYNSAGMRRGMKREPWPLNFDEARRVETAGKALRNLGEAVRDKDQALAGALVARYRELGGSASDVFTTLLGFATSEEGALHAEKYFRTVTEEFATTREAFRWRQLIGLARVSASEFGRKSAGYAEACELLGATV